MTPQPVAEQAVKETYKLLRRAAARRQPAAAMYDGLPRLLCPHVLGRKAGRFHVLVYQIGGRSNGGLRVASEAGVWRCLIVEKLSHVELRADAWRSGPRSPRQTCIDEIDFDRTLSPEAIRRKDNKADAAAAGEPERCAVSRSNADYAARGGRVAPRGRKSGAGSGAMNPR